MSAPTTAAPMTIRTNADPCRALWGMALIRALADAVTPNPIRQSHQSGSRVCTMAQREAQDWIGGRDFRVICGLAGLEPEPVAEWYERVMAGGDAARAEALKSLTGHDDHSLRGKRRPEARQSATQGQGRAKPLPRNPRAEMAAQVALQPRYEGAA